MWIHVYPNWKMNLNSKNSRKTNFSYEIKASKSFIRMRRVRLLCPIMKRKKIMMWIYIYPNWKSNFNSENYKKRCFSFETKALISFIPMRRICLWCPILKKMRLLCEFMFIPTESRTSILRMVESEVFLIKPMHENRLSQ